MRPSALVPGVRAHRRRVLPLLQRDRHRPQREGLARQGPRAQQQGEGHQLFTSCEKTMKSDITVCLIV